ncbi:DUF2891 family protein [Nocardioides mangrovicus]|uniref:DUF2891 family protein n=1 Tax=Nocardioides mangrovicus TaxID=2478913 RepID=A0A3L8NZQ8_9ACTN|nr:DUF2891 family protein [Nocardioides mangrovicus]RLV47588.1 DUF2891 family protein [Nocardioides mangrovicus]
MQHHEEWARTVHAVLTTPYPYAAQHVSAGPDDVDVTPSRLHPAFHGSFDWHSSVHMHWSALTLLPLVADPAPLRALLEERLTPAHVATEVAYLRAHPWFERPYGWAWAAALAVAADLPDLLEVVAELTEAWLPTLATPNRSGEHANLAFALSLLHACLPDAGLVEETARRLYLADRDAPVRWEPGPSDFLSPTLSEAELMRRVLPAEDFEPWLAAFLPDLEPLLAVAEVRDPTDGKGAHLLGLGLSRAWQLRSLAPFLPTEVVRAADAQVALATEHIAGGSFMSTHWLVSFALLAEGVSPGADTLRG